MLLLTSRLIAMAYLVFIAVAIWQDVNPWTVGRVTISAVCFVLALGVIDLVVYEVRNSRRKDAPREDTPDADEAGGVLPEECRKGCDPQ